ncbi:DNA-binding response regulator [Planotetraspora silvatica]|uniref:DNA-binding response regulator n=1 Tax=Planotetraspora silvatica TaxID=234614 RepID=A0A8J3UWP3_9ACTN|nr:response regulator transcription factor [Planotetraspora silvatica]GII49799.1 DNA-binding response regulator [Planotetraspora silvatica]
MTAETRVLVVDDEPNIRELLSAGLRFAGFDVVTASDGRQAVQVADQARPDLMLLDVMLPDMDGFAVAGRLRAAGQQIPVVFLTARDATDDMIIGLSLGDGYVTKPFSLEEVVARIRAVLRRTRVDREVPTSRLRVADLELDIDAHKVWRAGKHISLSATEFKLLHYFMVNQGRVISKAQILEEVWRYNFDFDSDGNVVESYVSYLRRKIDTADSKLIHTLRGVGYVLRVPRS